MIFLHGWKQDRHTWDGVVEHLKQDFTCWTLDLPGFGQNPRPDTAWTPADYANWVGEFVQKNSIKNPIIVGHSFGGRVAIILASDPSIFHIPYSIFVLYATPGFRQPLPRFTSMAGALARATKSWTPLRKFPLVKQIKEHLQSRDFKESDDMQDIFVATIEYDLSAKMTAIKTPTMLIWGEKDVEVPLKIGIAMQAAIPDSVLKIMPSGSHFAHRENPALFAGLVRKFAQK